ncbi:subtilisin, putative [Perkinsus marinus ATCC 50983]|uniref:subtilisin n=1 Tax=Perkinsus marinus (strain ATCC 50983 / TXsc) TaxID=423536 RepID=C5K9R7_PERM5|nr:subtilisin, putative [Perkinsus marinus ATCC 50983]EER18839.1 subtilisin, putative [Perkinsus marinus ATCC 50983]|eukprot:XP_002787043.1 subtilisin, putative [Perkinsus marinus ATCC 50983]
MLRDAGETPDQNIVAFLEATEITTLQNVKTQVVQSSAATIDSNELCDFVAKASSKLSLQSQCAMDATGKLHQASPGEAFGEYTNDLHVNDADAMYQGHLEWMKMGQVWQLALPHVTRRIKVAVIDSGVDWTDPDLAPLKGTLKKRSGGYIDGGWNFNTNSSTLTFANTHGTSVSKILAAKSNNSVGVAGMAPNVTLVPLQVMAKDSPLSLSKFLLALEMAIDIEVDIISVSLGFTLSAFEMELQHMLFDALRAVQQNNIILVASAGNDFEEASDVYPCWYGGPLGMCVASLYDYMWDNRTEPVLYLESNYGDRVDVAAYGTQLVVGRDKAGELIKFSGTSAAQPQVAGLAAILLSMNVEPSLVKRLILANAVPAGLEMPEYFPQYIRGGAIDPLRTVEHAISFLPSTPRGLRGKDASFQ